MATFNSKFWYTRITICVSQNVCLEDPSNNVLPKISKLLFSARKAAARVMVGMQPA